MIENFHETGLLIHMVIFFNLALTSNHLHPLQMENCDSNSQLVVDEDGIGKSRLKICHAKEMKGLMERAAISATIPPFIAVSIYSGSIVIEKKVKR